MKPEEAIDYLLDPIGKREKHDDAIQMAINALNKQIPMKPGAKEFAGEQVFGNPAYVIPCGNCGEALNRLHYYCPWCGQKIDWSEGET